jgi:protocatechuate 3,4-dioxygenase beta subunit
VNAPSVTRAARASTSLAVLAAALVAVPTGQARAASATCRPTSTDPAGPFEQTGAPAPRRAKIGTGHVLLGRVLRSGDCKPLRGAVVELWQAGPNGYTSRGRGSVVTDRFGRFRFEGPVPASDGGFAPHIHILVHLDGYDDLLTRYMVPSGERVGRVTLVLNTLL